MLERIRDRVVQERDLFVLDVQGVDDLRSLAELPSKHFACFVAWDADVSDVATVSRLAEILLDFGAVYVASWGQACELVQDVVDEVVASREVESGVRRPLVITTWHSDESLAEALWFLTFTASPDDAYLETCLATVAISIGSPERAEEIRGAFGNLAAFNASVIDAPHGAA
jgi:hypothetical protein